MFTQSISLLLSLLANPDGLVNHIPGDYIWDNDSDLVLQHEDNAFIKVWSTAAASCNGGYQAETLMPEPYGPVHHNWKIKAGGDLGGDGRPDIVFQNATSNALVVWDMWDLIRFDGGFLDPSVPNQPLALRCSAYFNNDHTPDLAFQNTDNGSVWVWVMDPDNPRRRLQAKQITGIDTAGYRLAGCGDFTGDGFADLVLEPANDQVLIAQVNNFAASDLVQVVGPGRAIWDLAAVGDLDRDGHFELIWERNDARKVEAWKMAGRAYQCTISISDTPDELPPQKWRVVGPR